MSICNGVGDRVGLIPKNSCRLPAMDIRTNSLDQTCPYVHIWSMPEFFGLVLAVLMTIQRQVKAYVPRYHEEASFLTIFFHFIKFLLIKGHSVS